MGRLADDHVQRSNSSAVLVQEDQEKLDRVAYNFTFYNFVDIGKTNLRK